MQKDCSLFAAGDERGVNSLIRYAHKWFLPGLGFLTIVRISLRLSILYAHYINAVCSSPYKKTLHFFAAGDERIELPTAVLETGVIPLN